MELKEGDKAPDFSLPASTGETISLTDLAGKKVVVYFYPKDNTPGCTTEACDFRDVRGELETAGAVVLGVSADSLKSHANFVDRNGLNFPLLSDADKTMAESYGAWGEKKNYGRTYMGMKRMTFLIDEQGAIEKIWPQVKVKGHAEAVLAQVKGG